MIAEEQVAIIFQQIHRKEIKVQLLEEQMNRMLTQRQEEQLQIQDCGMVQPEMVHKPGQLLRAMQKY